MAKIIRQISFDAGPLRLGDIMISHNDYYELLAGVTTAVGLSVNNDER